MMKKLLQNVGYEFNEERCFQIGVYFVFMWCVEVDTTVSLDSLKNLLYMAVLKFPVRHSW